MSAWPALPVFVRLEGRPVILLGDGEAADAKRRLLERAGAVVATDHPEARLAIVAIEDEGEAEAAVARLRARGLLVNAVDRPALCDFTLPAIVDRSPVLVAIGTGGVSAGLAAALRQRLEALLPSGLGRLARALHGARTRLRAALPDGGERRRAIAAALAGPLDPLAEWVADSVAQWLAEVERDGSASRPGESGEPVATIEVDAGDRSRDAELGPGFRRGGEAVGDEPAVIRLRSPDPDDLTLRQARLLANADRVFHAAAVPAAILDRARADAPRVVCATAPLAPGSGRSVFVEMA